MTEFWVRPMEPLFFGPPQSFVAGEAHRSRSQFPPTPMTFQGLVRARLLTGARPPLDLNDWSERARRERVELVGEPDSFPPSWQLEGPYPAERLDREGDGRRVCIWFPAPRFLFRAANAEQPPVRAKVVATPVGDKPAALDDLSLGAGDFLPVGAPADSTRGQLDGWLSSDNLQWALTGRGAWDPRGTSSLPPFVKREPRPGVAIDRDKATARPGLLYFLEAVRFAPESGLAGWLEGDLHPRLNSACLTTGHAGAGRRRRPVAFEEVPGTDPAWRQLRSGGHLPQRLRDATRVWVVLLTPARIDDPLRPALPTSGAVRAKVRAALSGDAETIGGYRLAQADVRPNRVYVPAGSAWLVELSGGSDEDRARVVRQWNGSHPLGPPEEAAFGFGHVIVSCDTNANQETV